MDDAKRLGMAFKLGAAFGKGAHLRTLIANDTIYEKIVKWITVNGAHIPVGKGGKPLNKTGEKALKRKITPELSSYLGKEIKNVKGKGAIKELIKEKTGYVQSAFHRDDIGDIDLAWGDDKSGLSHILKRRKEDNIDIEEFLNVLTETIQQGSLREHPKKGDRYEILKDGQKVIVSKEFKNGKIRLIVTAFRAREKWDKEPKGA